MIYQRPWKGQDLNPLTHVHNCHAKWLLTSPFPLIKVPLLLHLGELSPNTQATPLLAALGGEEFYPGDWRMEMWWDLPHFVDEGTEAEKVIA